MPPISYHGVLKQLFTKNNLFRMPFGIKYRPQLKMTPKGKKLGFMLDIYLKIPILQNRIKVGDIWPNNKHKIDNFGLLIDSGLMKKYCRLFKNNFDGDSANSFLEVLLINKNF